MAFIDAKTGWSGEWSRRKGNRAFPFFLPTWNGNRDLAYFCQKRKKGLYRSFLPCVSECGKCANARHFPTTNTDKTAYFQIVSDPTTEKENRSDDNYEG